MWFELAREGKIPHIPKRKEPSEEVEDDYEEGQIAEGPKEKKRKIEDKSVLVEDDSVQQAGDIVPPGTPVTASPPHQPSGASNSASGGSTLSTPAAHAIQQPSRGKARKRRSNTKRRQLLPHPDDPYTSLGPNSPPQCPIPILPILCSGKGILFPLPFISSLRVVFLTPAVLDTGMDHQ